MKYEVLCIGGITQDILFNHSQALKNSKKNKQQIIFELGQKYSSGQVWRSFGGGAINTAMSLHRLGIKVVPLAMVGNDLVGETVKKYLKDNGIKNKYVTTSEGQFTAFSFIINFPHANEHILFVSREVQNKFNLKDVKWPARKPQWIMLTSQRGIFANSNIKQTFDYQEKNDCQLFWNPGQLQIDNFSNYKKYFKQVDILSLNLAEAEQVLELLKLRKVKSADKMINELLKVGFKAVVVTAGEKGVYYRDKVNSLYVPAVKVNTINTTGAGDAFNAAFLAGYFYYQGNIKSALQLGVKNAAAIVTTIGAHNGGLKITDL